MARGQTQLRVHHILADGREVDSVEGHVINLKDFPDLARILLRAEREKREKEKAEAAANKAG